MHGVAFFDASHLDKFSDILESFKLWSGRGSNYQVPTQEQIQYSLSCMRKNNGLDIKSLSLQILSSTSSQNLSTADL